MNYTRRLVTLVIIVILGSNILTLRAQAESYQYDDNVTENIATHEQRKGLQHLYLAKKEIYNQIDSSMKVNKPCGLSKSEFIELLIDMEYDYNGVFARNAGLIWDLEQEYSVNALFVCGIAACESLWCSSKPAMATNNYTSQMASSEKLIHYETEEDCFRATFENLSNNYLSEDGPYYRGYTITSVNKMYCPVNSDWSNKVAQCMKMIFN